MANVDIVVSRHVVLPGLTREAYKCSSLMPNTKGGAKKADMSSKGSCPETLL